MGVAGGLSAEQLAEVFPFYFAVDAASLVRHVGPSLARVLGDVEGRAWDEVFRVVRPKGDRGSCRELERLRGALYVLEHVDTSLVLRGQFVTRSHDDGEDALFLGAPWFQDAAEMGEFALSVGDFAVHDPTPEFLFLLRVRDLAMQDARKLADALRRRSEELDRARLNAEEASETKSRLLANMSHEFRTPMHGIVAMASLLLESGLASPLDDYVRVIDSSAQSLLRVLGDVLDVAMIEAGTLRVEHAVCDLQQLVRDVAIVFTAQAAERDLEFSCQVDPSLPRRVVTDRARVRQVLTNVLGNAIKFTAEGSVSLDVRSVDGATIEFSVRDTGVGIPESARTTVFDAFVQVDSSATRAFDGAGLGLNIAKRVLGLLGGSIEFACPESGGTEFRFRVPLRTAREDEGSDRAEASDSALGLRVLVAEDNRINRYVIERMLARLGCTVELAEDGEAAVRKAADGAFDVILMDLQMPRLDGLEATRRIRQLEGASAAIPIVALTANSEIGREQVCRDSGMDGYASKPLGLDRLRALLRAHTSGGADGSSISRAAR